MGFAVDLIAFDDTVFQEEIFTSLREGETSALIKAELEHLQKGNKTYLSEGELNNYAHSFNGLKSVMNTFDSTFLTSSLGHEFVVLEGKVEKDQPSDQLYDSVHWGYEDLAMFFEYLTLKHCAKYYVNIGKQYSIAALFESNTLNYQTLSQLKQICDQLDGGFNYFQHGNGGFGEGISGWISKQETKDLHQVLQKIKIKNSTQYLDDLRIQDILKIVQIAAAENLGIISGRDLRLSVPNRPGVLKLSLETQSFSSTDLQFNGECV
ncbi:MAG TPA: hypothetical protein DCS93_20890 [Microscillaceae bacterium]|nr:hypothetical protein [Microscillaceae bacterium]